VILAFCLIDFCLINGIAVAFIVEKPLFRGIITAEKVARTIKKK